MMPVGTFLRDERGAAASEFALMLPLMLAILFGGFEAAHYFYTQHKVVKAVREGARYAGRLPFEDFGCDGGSGSATLVNRVRQVTIYGEAASNASSTPRIRDWDPNLITVTVTCDGTHTGGIYRSQVSGAPVVRVHAMADYPSLFETIGFHDSNMRVSAAAQASVNGI